MRILITGAAGQLGKELRAILAGDDVLATDLVGGPDVGELDLTDFRRTASVVSEFRPEVVIHGAAYTNVDGCELDPDLAFRANGLGTQSVALACQRADAALLYISTDYVFDGNSDVPYLEFDAPNPVSIYGRSKLAGEVYVRDLLSRFYIVRTAWLYGDGPKNFPKTILAAAAGQASAGHTPRLFGVTDEAGSPTWARDLAGGIALLIRRPNYGIYHLTNEGYCSRDEYVRAILELGGYRDAEVVALSAAEFAAHNPLPAKRPAFAVLRNLCAAHLGIRLRPWQEALAEFLCSSR